MKHHYKPWNTFISSTSKLATRQFKPSDMDRFKQPQARKRKIRIRLLEVILNSSLRLDKCSGVFVHFTSANFIGKHHMSIIFQHMFAISGSHNTKKTDCSHEFELLASSCGAWPQLQWVNICLKTKGKYHITPQNNAGHIMKSSAWPSPWAQWVFHPSLTSAKVLWEILEDSKDPSVFGVEAGFTHNEISEASYEYELYKLWISIIN